MNEMVQHLLENVIENINLFIKSVNPKKTRNCVIIIILFEVLINMIDIFILFLLIVQRKLSNLIINKPIKSNVDI